MSTLNPLNRLDLLDRLSNKEEQARALLLNLKGNYVNLNEALQHAYVQTILDLLDDMHEAANDLIQPVEVQA